MVECLANTIASFVLSIASTIATFIEDLIAGLF